MNIKLINTIHTLANFLKEKHPELRLGQCLMNALFACDRGIYDKISGTDADCFYVDEKIEKFWEAVANRKP